MEITKVDYTKNYRLISHLWNSALPGRGTLSRFLSKILVPKPTSEVISKNIYGFDLRINPVIDNGVEHSLYYFGTYERGTLNFIKEHLKAGEIFFDIGANIGLMSIFASQCVGRNGKVISFEANPGTVELLRSNLAINKIENVTVIDKAIGDSRGTVQIYSNWNVNRGGATLVKPESSSSESFSVEMIALDSESQFNDLKVKMVKIDVEGFELNVLKGMKKILSSSTPPILIVECSSTRKNDYDSVFELYRFICSVNRYRIYKLSNGKERSGKLVEIFNEGELPHHDNIFCLPA